MPRKYNRVLGVYEDILWSKIEEAYEAKSSPIYTAINIRLTQIVKDASDLVQQQRITSKINRNSSDAKLDREKIFLTSDGALTTPAIFPLAGTAARPIINPHDDDVIKELFEQQANLVSEIKRILTERIDSSLSILDEKIEDLTKEIKVMSDGETKNNKTIKCSKLNGFKKELNEIKTNMDFKKDEGTQLTFRQARDRINTAAQNAKLGIPDHTNGFKLFINSILAKFGFSIKIKVNTLKKVETIEKTVDGGFRCE